MNGVAAILVKDSAEGKSRLASALLQGERAKLVEAMLKDIHKVLRNSGIETVLVGGERYAPVLGVRCISDPGEGLNAAIEAAKRYALIHQYQSLIILPCDIPLINEADIGAIIEASRESSIVLSPTQRGGTAVLLLKHPFDYRTQYGHDSFSKHVREAKNKGHRFVIYESESLRLDIDLLEDLKRLMELDVECETLTFLHGLTLDTRLSHD